MEEVEIEDTKTLSDYINIAKRHEYKISIPMLVFFGISIIIALILPPVYRSEATILIEQQRIPQDLIETTVTSFADERIHQIQQKLLTINNIHKIIEKYNLYSAEKKSLSQIELAERFRDNAGLEMTPMDVIIQGRAQKVNLTFKLWFDDRNPVIAQKVANEIVNLFLDENKRARTQSAADTSEFLEDEVKRFDLEIKKTEQALSIYKEKNGNSLPELLPANLAMMNRTESELLQLGVQERMLTERITSLRSQFVLVDPVVMKSGDNKTIPDSLPALEEQYQELLGKYSKTHPDVKSLERKISNFKEKNAGKGSLKANNPLYLQLQSDIRLAEVELKSIASHKEELNKKLKQIQDNIIQTPRVERQYNDLMRDLENLKNKYTETKSKSLQASSSLTLEEEQKGEKFSVLEPALTPDKPEKPNRLKIFFIGLAMSVGAGVGIGFVAEALDETIRGHKKLALIAGAEPLIVIPYIKEQIDDTAKHRKSMVNFILIGVIFLIILVVLVHHLYMPLDVIWSKVWYRLSSF